MRQSTRVLIALLALSLLTRTLFARSAPEILSDGSPEQISSVINAMNRLESQTKDPEKKIKLRINSIRLEVGLAQKIRLSENKDKDRSLIEKTFLSAEARATALDKNLSQMSHLSEIYQHQVYFLRGVARYYLEKTKESLFDFDRYLNSTHSKKDKEREWVLQVAAEEHFEAENFSRSEALYRELLSKKNTTREFYQYKLAWALVNQEKMDQAEKVLAQLAVEAQDQALQKDSVKDLAFVVTRTKSEGQILEISSRLFPKAEEKTSEKRVLFLETALSSLENLGRLGKDSRLRSVLLSQQRDPERRFRIKVDAVLGLAREYASMVHATSVLELIREDAGRSSQSEALELASQKAIRSFSESYSGRAKTPEDIEKKQVAKTLVELSKNHLKIYPQSKVRSEVYQVLLGVCQAEEDWKCTSEVSREILVSQSLKDLHSRAQVAEIIALEKLAVSTRDPKIQERLMDSLKNSEVIIKDDPAFIENSLVRAAELYAESKDYAASVVQLEKVFYGSKLPSHELWYRLQWTRLQAEQYEKMVSENPHPKESLFSGNRNSKLNDVLATAYLKLAGRAKEEKDILKFKDHAEMFLKYQPSGEAAKLVRLEWVALAIESLGLRQAAEIHMAFPVEWQALPEAIKQREFLLSQALSANLFDLSFNLSSQWPQKNPPKTVIESSVFSKLMNSGANALSESDLLSLDAEVRPQWLSTLTLTDPEWVISYLRKNGSSDAKSREYEVRLYLVALRMMNGAWFFKPSSIDQRFLGKHAEYLLEYSDVIHPLEKDLEKVAFPVLTDFRKMSDIKAAAVLKKLILKIRGDRQRVVEVMKAARFDQKMRLVLKQTENEQRIADLIVNSSMPSGLSPEQAEEYRVGLVALAKEYIDQSEELKRVYVGLSAQVESRKKLEQKKILPPLKDHLALAPEGWDSKESAYKTLILLRERKNFSAALIELDRLRGMKKIRSDEEYFRARTALLLERRSDVVMRRYLYDELQEPSAKAVLTAWIGDQKGGTDVAE